MRASIIGSGSSITPNQAAYFNKRVTIATQNPGRISAWASANANRRGIRFNNTRFSKLASAISRLSDSEAELDPTEQLLVALSKAKVITISQLGELQISYLRHSAKSSNVRSIR
jgi:predicted LPLAT superfamily acyltransferase